MAPRPGIIVTDDRPRSGADLHAHTTCSDGTLPPDELIVGADAAGLRAIAVTDHDTTDGAREALRAAAIQGLLVVPGIEVSCQSAGREIHMLGLFIDPDDPGLLTLSDRQRGFRHERAEVMANRLRGDGVDIALSDFESEAGRAPIGRPHIAAALVRAEVVSTNQEAFDRYIGAGRPAFVPKQAIAADDAIAVIHAAGGVAVVAHPGSSRVREARIRELAEAGLDGLEVRHPRHGAQRERILEDACDRLGLLPSGGSDFHGPGRGDSRIGQHRVPYAWCEQLRRRAEARGGRRGDPGSEPAE